MKSNYECTYPLTCMSLAICRHAELGCTARLSEVTGLSQAVALTRPSVVWLNLQSSLRENCPPWIAIAYPGPDIPTYQASCGRVHCRIKMVDGTDNQKKVENAENKTALCSIRYT